MAAAAGFVLLPGAVLSAVIVSAATPTAAAPSQTSADLRQKAGQLANKLEALSAQAERYNEQFRDSEVEAKQLQAGLGVVKAQVDESRAKLALARGQAADYVKQIYVAGPSDSLRAVDIRNLSEISVRRTYLDLLRGDRQQVSEDLRNFESDLADKEQTYKAAKAAVDKKVAEFAKAKKETDKATKEYETLLATTQGELRAALEREQEARRQAEAAAAQAEASRLMAQAAQARQRAASAPAASAGGVRRIAAVGRTGGTRGAGAARAASGNAASTKRDDPPSPAEAAPVDAGPPPAGGSSAVSYATSMIGVPYRWGGSSPSGFDCSGLVIWAYAKAGRPGLPHSSSALRAMTRSVSLSEAVPGDLVFFPGHVGIYVGGGRMVHAPHTGDHVKIAPLHRGLIKVGRL